MENSLQRALTSLGSRGQSMMNIGLEPISEADSNSVTRGGVGVKQSRMCHSDQPQQIRVSAARSGAVPKQDACSTTVPPRKVRPRGNAAPAAVPGDLYSFAALPTVPDAGAPSTSDSPVAPMSAARAGIAAARASSRRNSLQSMQAAAEKNNPYAALASSLGGMQGAAPVGLANSFASADARVGGKSMPSKLPTARAAVTFDSFAMADARVGGAAMPPRPGKASGPHVSGGASAGLEGQQGMTAVKDTVQSASVALEATNPYAAIMSTAVRPVRLPPTPFAATDTEDKTATNNEATTATDTEDNAQLHSGFSALSMPVPVATDRKDDDDQPPPNPFASSSKRQSVPQLEGWRVSSS